MVLVLVLVTAVVIVLRAPAERDRLRKRAETVAGSGSATARVDASDDRNRAVRLDRLARDARWVVVWVAVALVVVALSSLVAHHG